MENIPSAYVGGYAKARAVDREAADNYIRHTAMGDAVLDPIMEELASMPPADLHRFIGAGIEQQQEVLREAPQILRDFIESLDEPPPWLDYDAFRPGIRTFHANLDLMLVAFVAGVLVVRFLDADRQVVRHHRARVLDHETPPAEQPPHDGHFLSRRLVQGE